MSLSVSSKVGCIQAHAPLQHPTARLWCGASRRQPHCGGGTSLWAPPPHRPSVPESVRLSPSNKWNRIGMIYLVIRHAEQARRWWMTACPYTTRIKRRQFWSLRSFFFFYIPAGFVGVVQDIVCSVGTVPCRRPKEASPITLCWEF
jgi:hypothetical protein